MAEDITIGLNHKIGEIEEENYITERDCLKNQIYLHKTNFTSFNGKEKYEGLNCIGISLHICKKLISKSIKTIYFIIKNYPERQKHSLRKISLTKFLCHSITIKESNFDEQRITAMEELEIVKWY